MTSISNHLHVKPYQVAFSHDENLILRKWDHRGTINAVTHREAAYKASEYKYNIVREFSRLDGTIFVLSNGQFIRVAF